MSHELWCITGNMMTNITPIVGSITRRSNINELGEQLDFDIAFNDARFFPKNPVKVGSLIILKNGDKEVTRAIAVKENKSPYKADYHCFDYAFYLNKSKAVYQFKKMQASKAISKILRDFNIPIGNICNISYPITKIYSGNTVSEIIKDILSQSEKALGTKYRMEMRQGKLYIEPQKSLIINPAFQIASNIGLRPITSTISNPTKTQSIEDTKNSIKVITGNDEKMKVVANVKNDALIKQYGLLQEVVSVGDKDIAQAKTIAKNTLKELGKVFEKSGLEMIGHDDVRAGRIIAIEEPLTGLKGNYLITDANHTIKNGIHTVKVGLEAV